MMNWSETEQIIQKAWSDTKLRRDARVVQHVSAVIEALDEGEVRVAEPVDGSWRVNQWVKQAVLLYFVHRDVEVSFHGPFEYRDKIPLKRGFEKAGVRVVPPATVRFGAFVGRDAVLMPSYINIGAYVGEGSMVDTWATVGSCAQIGKGVHLSGGVGIGGVLEPIQAAPVIVEDGAFIGSRCIVVEGVRVEEQAVLGSGVVVTSSTPVIDVTGAEPVEIRGSIPARSVVVPGTRAKQFPAGTFEVQCALIIGRRQASTDLKTSLNEVLREYGIPT
jgi:2,3,4,5-tetrahydropyridine-2-carboxylate N-succinyltransferase